MTTLPHMKSDWSAAPTIGKSPTATYYLLWILVLGLAIRLGLWAGFRNEPIHIWDERDYNILAKNLVEFGEFTFSPGGIPTSLRPPLYPAFVALGYSVFGIENFAAIRALQVIVSLLTVVVVYSLGRAVASQRVGIWAAGIFCFYPSLLVSNNFLLTETLFTFLLTSACYLIVVALRRHSLPIMAAGGVVLGLAALTRSVVWLAPPFLAVFVALAWDGGWTKRLLAATTVIVAFAMTIAPWAVRNSQLQKTFVAIDVMGGRNFMMGNYRYTPLYRSWDAISLNGDQSWSHEVQTNYPMEKRNTQGQVDKLALRQGMAFVRENPGLTAQRSAVKFFDFWGLERELIAGAGKGYFGSISKAGLVGLTAIVIAGYVSTLFLAIYGCFCVPPANLAGRWLLLCVIAFVCGMHTLVFGHSRYHLPLMPIVGIFAACAIVRLGEVWRQRGTARFAGATAVCGLLVCGWVWSLVAVDWERFVSAWNSAV